MDTDSCRVVTVLGASLGILLAVGVRVTDCKEEASSACSTASLLQLLGAVVGLIPAVGTFVESVRRRGRALPWFLMTALIYAVWGLYVWQEFGS
jgi:hypothetical protein